jgi:hypothetical protein
MPEAENQDGHDSRDDVLDGGEANGGEFFFAVEHSWVRLRARRYGKTGDPFSRKG